MPIFNDKEIKIESKHFFDNSFYEKGFFIINDLIDENGNFHTYDSFKQIHNLRIKEIAIVKYSLKSATWAWPWSIDCTPLSMTN